MRSGGCKPRPRSRRPSRPPCSQRRSRATWPSSSNDSPTRAPTLRRMALFPPPQPTPPPPPPAEPVAPPPRVIRTPFAIALQLGRALTYLLAMTLAVGRGEHRAVRPL